MMNILTGESPDSYHQEASDCVQFAAVVIKPSLLIQDHTKIGNRDPLIS